MKKAILALCLLIIVVGVTYVKMVRGSAQCRNSFQEGRKATSEELLLYHQKVDSLRYLIGQQEVVFSDSLVRKDITYQMKIDSLILALDSVWATVDTDSIEQQPIPDVELQDYVDSTGLSQPKEEILTFYDSLFEDLPSDLTKYEQKVALHEIRLKTTQTFSITLSDLKALCSQADITY